MPTVHRVIVAPSQGKARNTGQAQKVSSPPWWAPWFDTGREERGYRKPTGRSIHTGEVGKGICANNRNRSDHEKHRLTLRLRYTLIRAAVCGEGVEPHGDVERRKYC